MFRHYQELAGPVFVPAAAPTGLGETDLFRLRQYQELAGPVFVPAYALSWLPIDRQPARSLARRGLGGYARPELEGIAPPPISASGETELYKLRQYQELAGPVLVPAAAAPTGSGETDLFDLTQYQEFTGPVFVPAAGFDPASLSWGPAGAQPQRGIAPRRIGDFAPVQFEDLYRAEGLEWGSRAPSPRFNPARRVAYSVTDPFPPAAPFDPSGLQWKPIETGSRSRIPVPRITYSVTDPFPVAAPTGSGQTDLFDLLQYQDVTGPVFVPAAAPFDPAGLQWIPRDRITHRARRQVRGELLQPPRAPLYDPSRIEWLSSGRYAGRALQRYRVTYEVEDLLPRPRAPTPVAPVEEVTYGPIQQPFRPTLRLRPRARFQKRRLREPKKLRQYRREIRLLTERTEALAAALTYAEQQQNAEALAAALRMAEAVQIELTAYLERRRMMQVIAITLLLLEDA